MSNTREETFFLIETFSYRSFMKFTLILFFLLSLNVHASTNETNSFTVRAEHGFLGTCESVENNENQKIVKTHLRYLREVRLQAKEECEAKTKQICGLISWEPVYVLGTYMTAKLKGCFAQAVAAPIQD